MKLRGLAPEFEAVLEAHSQPGSGTNTPGSASNCENFNLITTLRYDPNLPGITRHIPIALSDSFDQKFFLSHLHYQRLKYGAKVLGWDTKLTYGAVCDVLEEAVEKVEAKAYKIRLTLESNGKLSATLMDTERRKNLFSGLLDPSNKDNHLLYEVTVDSQRLPEDFGPKCTSSLKTTDRTLYNEVRERNEITGHKEALLVNHQGFVTEGTVTSVAFQRGDKWVTPPLADGAMVSTLRSFMLELEYITEESVSVNDIKVGDHVLLFNGVIGVVRGTIQSV